MITLFNKILYILYTPRYESVSKMGLNMVGAEVIQPDASDGTEPENPYEDGK